MDRQRQKKATRAPIPILPFPSITRATSSETVFRLDTNLDEMEGIVDLKSPTTILVPSAAALTSQLQTSVSATFHIPPLLHSVIILAFTHPLSLGENTMIIGDLSEHRLARQSYLSGRRRRIHLLDCPRKLGGREGGMTKPENTDPVPKRMLLLPHLQPLVLQRRQPRSEDPAVRPVFTTKRKTSSSTANSTGYASIGQTVHITSSQSVFPHSCRCYVQLIKSYSNPDARFTDSI